MKISRWNELYENAASRKLRTLSWVPVPNKHDGENFSELMQHKHASEIFAAWILMLQIASRSQTRGELIRDNGDPHTPRSLSLKTRGKLQWFETAIPVLLKMGWISDEMGDSPNVPGDSPNVSGLKGREGNRRNQKKEEGRREAQQILIEQSKKGNLRERKLGNGSKAEDLF